MRTAAARFMLESMPVWIGLFCYAAVAAEPTASDHQAAIPNDKCLECHGEKDLTKDLPNGRQLSLFVDEKIRQASVHARLDCADCHADLTDKHPDDSKPAKPVACAECHKDQSDQYAASIHGVSRAMGSSGAATCTSCHGTHDMLSPSNPNSPVFKLNLARTCAKCHDNKGITDEYRMRFPHVAEQYLDSIHGHGVKNMGLVVAPSCNDCHGVHDIKRSVDRNSPINKANVAATCGKCHLGIEEKYKQSVHGQLLAKGDARGPACNDCHSAHEIETPGNAHFKQLNDKRCGKCHEDSLEHYRDTYHGKAMALGRPNAATDVAACYDCHGDHNILPVANPASQLSKQNIRATCAKCHPGATEGFTRYAPHANPLDGKKYPALHLIDLIRSSWCNRGALRDPATGKWRLGRFWGAVFGADSMVPSLQDWREFIAHQKWFFGKGPKPQFDRWTYWEKFDYFAVFWGVFAIGLSGMIMWFPQFFTAFLPGWVINIALIVHSDEALLAAGFIFTIHFFNTHFRLEKFPMDNVIFSGRISKTEMLHERKRWHDRLVAEGRLDQHRVRDEWDRWKRIARPIGFTFFGIGLVLLVLIIYAMITRLTH